LGKRSRSRHDAPAAAASPLTTAATPPERAAARAMAVCAALALLVAAIYAQLRTHAFINYDDPAYVTRNAPVLRGLTAAGVRWAFTSVHAAYWHPLTWLSHMLDVSLFGLDAGRHLLVSAAIHAINAVLLFLWLRRATGAIGRSAAVAALFAVHPLHVESVAWVAERKDVLSAFFMLLALHAYTRWVQTRAPGQYVWSVIALALGLMAKPMLVTVPFVLLLLDVWPFRRRALLEKLPYLVLIVPVMIVTMRTQSVAMAGTNVPLPVRLGNAAIACVTYLGKTIWPANLAVVYPYPASINPLLAAVCALLLLAITAAAILARRRMPWLTVGWLWFVVMLVPVIGIVQVGLQSMADRFTYLPHIGLFIAWVWSLAALVEKRVALAAAAAAIVALAVLAHAQAGYWRNSITLFEHALAVTKNNRLAHLNFGAALFDDHQFARAEAEYRAAAGFRPADLQHLGLALALHAQGKLDEAVSEAEQALRANPANAEARAALYDARIGYGAFLNGAGRDDEATRQFEAACLLRPAAPEPHVYLALVKANRRRLGEAAGHAAHAIAVDHDGANRVLIAAIRTAPRPTAIDEYLAFLRQQAAAP
jgi:tetratricopeptide (TPR) repeat protein